MPLLQSQLSQLIADVLNYVTDAYINLQILRGEIV